MYTFNFPSIKPEMRPDTIRGQFSKIMSELTEAETAATPCEQIIELFDVIHAAETALDKIVGDMQIPNWDKRTVFDSCYRYTIAKNMARGYYEDGMSEWLVDDKHER